MKNAYSSSMIGLDFFFLLQHIKDNTIISKSVRVTIAPDRAIPRFRKRVSLSSESIASFSVVVAAEHDNYQMKFLRCISVIINNYLDLVGKARQYPLSVDSYD